MANQPLPPAELLRKILAYDANSGELTWLPRPASMFEGRSRPAATLVAIWNRRYAHTPALAAVMANGYLHGSINDIRVLRHRVIWKLVTGDEPDQIDHINGNRSDNRWSNLRDVTHSENGRNQRLGTANTSGIIGVSFCRRSGKWRATITRDGKGIHLGLHARKEDAGRARLAAERRLDFHPNHGARTAHAPSPK